MWRSSQPKCGVSGACTADEKLLDLIAQSCVFKRTPTGTVKATGDPLLCIIDCRPKVMGVCVCVRVWEEKGGRVCECMHVCACVYMRMCVCVCGHGRDRGCSCVFSFACVSL